MKFDNNGSVIRIQMQKRLLAVAVATFIAILYTTGLWRFVEQWAGIPRFVGTLFFLSLFLVFYFYHLLAASSFFYYDDHEGKIVVRNYQLNMFNTAKNSFEIPKSEFKGYAFKQSTMGLRTDLILYRRHKGRMVTYPPVSISLLTTQELGKLKKALDSHGPLLELPKDI